MKKWLLERLKNKFILVIIGTAVILFLFVPIKIVFSSGLIVGWLGYIYLAVNKSSFLTVKEKRITHLSILILSVLAISTVQFHEILTLLALMATRSDIAILIWFKAGKSFWLTALASAAVNTIGLVVVYTAADLFKTHIVDKHGKKLYPLPGDFFRSFKNQTLFKKFSAEKNIKMMLTEITAVMREITRWRKGIKIFQDKLRARLNRWVAGKELWVLLAIFAAPLPIPYLPTIIIVAMRYRNIRYGLWWLMAINFIKSIVFVWLIWQGLVHI